MNEHLLNLLGLETDADGATVFASVQALKQQLEAARAEVEAGKQAIAAASAAADPAKYVPVEAVESLKTDLAALRQAEAARRIDELVKPALADGRLIPTLEDWARTLGAASLPQLEAFLEKATPIPALKGSQTKGIAPGNSDGGDPIAAARTRWEGSSALRAEFDSIGAYLAYVKAEANGQVKILRSGSQE